MTDIISWLKQAISNVSKNITGPSKWSHSKYDASGTGVPWENAPKSQFSRDDLIGPTPTPTRAPVPMPTPTPSQRTTEHLAQVPNSQNIADMILAAFPQTEGYNPVNIASIESSLNPQATGDLGERGLFQILPSTFQGELPRMQQSGMNYTLDDLYDIAANIAVAKWLYERYGWSPWTGSAPQLGLI